MAKKSPVAPPAPKPYEVLALRLQRAINNPTAQKNKSALLERLDSDSDDAWEQIMAELAETDNVTVAHRDDGHIQIFWTVVQDD
ncbi:DUF1654 domain-containing protein [Pseudomonas sp. hsmgli-8]|uniref:DUF1654 domain-containing protein n=1 Tax=Pseudomonas quercus TaxID=2722792 RepID=A0ABX0YJH4_9PSED|nr:DUF1654 domain-containing protein [Pseudomonas quercus]NJP03628.1 DUF1654 domain-containing protein [Pseudomonas quercus]